MIDAYADSINMGPEPDTIGYLLRCGARVEEVQVQMHERMAGVSYLTLGRSMKYMLEMCVSMLVVQWSRKKIQLEEREALSMSLALRILLMIFSVGFVYFVLKRIHKDQLRIQDSIFWILLSVLVLILAFFPQIAIGMAQQLGIISPVNFVFLVFIFCAFIKIFSMAAKISNLEDKINKLSYEEAKRRMQEQEVEGAQNEPGTMDERKAV